MAHGRAVWRAWRCVCVGFGEVVRGDIWSNEIAKMRSELHVVGVAVCVKVLWTRCSVSCVLSRPVSGVATWPTSNKAEEVTSSAQPNYFSVSKSIFRRRDDGTREAALSRVSASRFRARCSRLAASKRSRDATRSAQRRGLRAVAACRAARRCRRRAARNSAVDRRLHARRVRVPPMPCPRPRQRHWSWRSPRCRGYLVHRHRR